MPVKGADDLETLLEAVGLKLSPLQMEPLPKTEAEFTAEMKLPFFKDQCRNGCPNFKI